ncbi:MAG: FAD-dependent oxidoreductase [Pirellulales bacterium]|nr:FAD-dependent oxidoreductase [Pirellulales bacterium]
MNSQPTAIVIGGGVIGCASAYYLAREGWQVRLLERDQLGSGASVGNCGYVSPSHVLPMAGPGAITKILRTMMRKDSAVSISWQVNPALWSWLARFALQCRHDSMMESARARHALLRTSMELYRQLLSEEEFACEWQDQGLLIVYKSPRDFEAFRTTAALLEETFGVVATPYVGDEVSHLESTLRTGLGGGWLFPGDAHVRPEKMLGCFRKAILKHGVSIAEGVAVESLAIEGRRVKSLETSQGSTSADVVVLATGAEASCFAKPLKCRIPIQPGKGYSLTMPSAGGAPKIPMIFEAHHVAVTPFDGFMRIGSTMEFAGFDRSLNRKRLSLLRKSAKEHLVALPPGEHVEEWAGWRPMTYDGLPCIDKAPGAENVIVAAGNGMIGLSTAPATGKLVAQLASGKKPHIDPQPYSLHRFA